MRHQSNHYSVRGTSPVVCYVVAEVGVVVVVSLVVPEGVSLVPVVAVPSYLCA